MIGKRIGGSVYVHKDYLNNVVEHNDDIRDLVLGSLRHLMRLKPFPYVVVKINPAQHQVTFVSSPDFDTADEPTVGDAILVKSSGEVKFISKAADPWVYHGKELMVGEDYKGFDVQKAVEHHREWEGRLKGVPHYRIGKRSVWESWRKKQATLTVGAGRANKKCRPEA